MVGVRRGRRAKACRGVWIGWVVVCVDVGGVDVVWEWMCGGIDDVRCGEVCVECCCG